MGIPAWAVGATVFVAAIAWPSLAFVYSVLRYDGSGFDVPAFSARSLGLVWKSAWLSIASTALSLALCVPAASCLAGKRGISGRPVLLSCLAATLFCPPMVYSFGWQKILPADLSPVIQCIAVWSLWAWPIPALLLGGGLSRLGRERGEAALLDASRTQWVVFVLFGPLRRHLLMCGLLLFSIFFAEYTVPHTFGLVVYATELLGWASYAANPAEAIGASLPGIAVIGGALGLAFGLWRGAASGTESLAGGRDPRSARVMGFLAFALFIVAWATPIALLAARFRGWADLAETLRVYRGDILRSVGAAAASAPIVTAAAVVWISFRRLRLPVLFWTILLGALPGAVVGTMLIFAYNHAATSWVYDHWPIAVICHVARFSWIAVVGALLVERTVQGPIAEQARADGADGAQMLRHVVFPLARPILFFCTAVVASQSLADVAAVTMLRSPDFTPISLVIIEKFHRFEDGILAALSFLLVAMSLPAAAMMTTTLRRWNIGEPA